MNNPQDVANYHRSTDEEKNVFWMKELKKPYSKVSIDNRVKMLHTSKLVETYINSNEEERAILWRVYDGQSQLFCDRDRFIKRYELQKALKEIS